MRAVENMDVAQGNAISMQGANATSNQLGLLTRVRDVVDKRFGALRANRPQLAFESFVLRTVTEDLVGEIKDLRG